MLVTALCDMPAKRDTRRCIQLLSALRSSTCDSKLNAESSAPVDASDAELSSVASLSESVFDGGNGGGGGSDGSAPSSNRRAACERSWTSSSSPEELSDKAAGSVKAGT